MTLGLTTQRELDARGGQGGQGGGHRGAASTDTAAGGDREALIGQLRAERDQAAREAGAGGRRPRRPEPLFDDPFKR